MPGHVKGWRALTYKNMTKNSFDPGNCPENLEDHRILSAQPCRMSALCIHFSVTSHLSESLCMGSERRSTIMLAYGRFALFNSHYFLSRKEQLLWND